MAIKTSTQTSASATTTQVPFAERGLKLVQDNREKLADQAADKVVDFVLPEPPIRLPLPRGPLQYINLPTPQEVAKKHLSNRFESELEKHTGTGGKSEKS